MICTLQTTRSTRSTRLPTRSTRFSTGSTRFSTRSSRLFTLSTRLSIRLSTRSICLSTRSTRSTICRTFITDRFKHNFIAPIGKIYAVDTNPIRKYNQKVKY